MINLAFQNTFFSIKLISASCTLLIWYSSRVQIRVQKCHDHAAKLLLEKSFTESSINTQQANTTLQRIKTLLYVLHGHQRMLSFKTISAVHSPTTKTTAGHRPVWTSSALSRGGALTTCCTIYEASVAYMLQRETVLHNKSTDIHYTSKLFLLFPHAAGTLSIDLRPTSCKPLSPMITRQPKQYLMKLESLLIKH